MLKDIKYFIKAYYRLVIVISLFILFISSLVLLFSIVYRRNTIIFADVGQGDGILIKLENGENILYDTGKEDSGVNNIERFLNISDNIDYMILSHSDSDHSGQKDYFIKKYNIKNIYLNTKETFQSLSDKSNVSPLQKGDRFLLGDIIFDIINPNAKKNYNEENQSSVSMIMSYNNFRFIFLADIGKDTERELIADGVFDNMKDKIVILKVGHHGSNTSSSELLLKRLSPKYCVISVGANNSYNHPHPEAMNILNKYCENILRTDIMGNIIFSVHNNDLEINYFK